MSVRANVARMQRGEPERLRGDYRKRASVNFAVARGPCRARALACIPTAPACPSRPLPDLSVVVPLYNEEESVGPLVDAVREALAAVASWELVLVDDGSRDATVQSRDAPRGGATSASCSCSSRATMGRRRRCRRDSTRPADAWS